MKKIAFALILISFFAFCKKALEKADYIVTICGTITNPLADYITIRNYSGLETKIDTARVDTNGYFNIKLEINEPDYYVFRHHGENAYLFLCPGDSIYLTLNTEKFDETLTFSGRGDKVNNYLIKKFLLIEKIEPDSVLYKLEKNEFIAKTDSIYALMKKYFNNFIHKEKDIPERFIKLEQAKILYTWANMRILYPEIHKYYTKKETIDLGENYNDYLSEINFNDSNLLKIREYVRFLENYLTFEVSKDTAIKEVAPLKAKFNIALKIFTDNKVKNHILWTILNNHIKYVGVKGIDTLLDEFKNICTDTIYISNLVESYKKWLHLAEGEPAPTFSYPDINNNVVSLTDFRGKYVYIDVWASWCSPCRKEIPYFNKLVDEFKDKNIVFIGVSIDDKKANWEKMITEKNMKGIQLFADKAWNSDIAKNYLIKSIPRFILIDKEGKIIDVNAEAPSGKIREVLLTMDE